MLTPTSQTTKAHACTPTPALKRVAAFDELKIQYKHASWLTTATPLKQCTHAVPPVTPPQRNLSKWLAPSHPMALSQALLFAHAGHAAPAQQPTIRVCVVLT
jgi:hypothetical protein